MKTVRKFANLKITGNTLKCYHLNVLISSVLHILTACFDRTVAKEAVAKIKICYLSSETFDFVVCDKCRIDQTV